MWMLVLLVDCCHVRRHSWAEAARVLQRAVEESKKLKRRGTPNVIVFAGMTLPRPFEFPILISQRHVNFLHGLAKQLQVTDAKAEVTVDPGAFAGGAARADARRPVHRSCHLPVDVHETEMLQQSSVSSKAHTSPLCALLRLWSPCKSASEEKSIQVACSVT
jgi:hypothetical protein